MLRMRKDVAGRRGAVPDGLLDPILFGVEPVIEGQERAEPIAAPGERKLSPENS
jgi:hypothetical protein